MKKLPVFIIALISAAVLIIACNKEEEIKLDFDLTVPDNWSAFIYANEGYIYDARRIAENEQDTLLEGLVIFKTKQNGSTLNNYYNSLKDQIIKSAAYDSLLYDTDTLVNGTTFKKLLSMERLRYINPAYYDTFMLNAITVRYFFYENNFGYNMTFLSIDTAYRRNRAVFDGIMSTFHFHE